MKRSKEGRSDSDEDDDSTHGGEKMSYSGQDNSPANSENGSGDSNPESGSGSGSSDSDSNAETDGSSVEENNKQNNNDGGDGDESVAASDSESGSGSSSASVSASGSDSGSESGGGYNSSSNSDTGTDGENGKADSSMNASRSSSHSKSSSNSTGSRNRSGLKKFWDEDPDTYGIRRSGRERKQPERILINREQSKNKSRRRSSSQWNSSELSLSEDSGDDSDDYFKRRPKKKTISQKSSYRKPTSRRNNSEDEFHPKPKRSARGATSTVSYKENSEEDENGDEDLVDVDWGNQAEEQQENVQSIEKVLAHRKGKKGAVGMQTYIYEAERNGDPNSNFDPNDPSQSEDQYLIKWKGWAYLHNTWESLESLKTQKVKGMKKLENYLRREEEIRIMKSRMTPEDVEYIEIQSELEKDLHASHLIAERIFAETNNEDDSSYFYVKWRNLPYSEATWESENIVVSKFASELEAFRAREKSSCFPKQCPALKHRPKFTPLKMQPDFIGGDSQDYELRDYQMDGLNWLIHSWCKHNSAILADEMGLGKTIQTIAFLSYLFHVHHLYGPFLLVVPLSTMNAWQREFFQWAPDMNVIVYIGDRDSRRIIYDYEWTFNSKRIKFNAVLTTNEILLRDKEVLQESCQWAALVIDEAHRLKNEESQLYHALQEFKSNHRLLVTGTPLQNSLKELWALLHFIMPDKFDDWEYFESQHDSDNMKKGFHRLHRQLEPYLLRRVKKDVEKSLPSKVEQILRVDMTQLQKQYYKWILTKNYEMLRKGSRGSTSGFVNIVMELKKCCNHAYLTKEDENAAPTNNSEVLQQMLRGSGKLMLLDKLLVRLNETGHRVLVFSQMVRMLDILAHYLELRRFPFQRLDGSINGELRRQALDHFNADGSSDFCFLLSTRAGGLGINLATADTVIIYDSDWNPQNDLQAQARAHRIGQKNQVNIYRLVTKNSIEETIIERAKQKMVLDHLVIQSMDTSGRTVFNKKISGSNSTPFNKEELNAILKFKAEELFKDDDENEEEPMCDIDEILSRAETRDEGPSSAGDELLSAFKVASFNLDEEEEVSKMEIARSDQVNRDWDDIIPANIRADVAEEERKKEMAELFLPPRKRKTLNSDELKDESGESPRKRHKKVESDGSEYEEESDPEKPRPRGRPRLHRKDAVKGFTDAEIRRFVRSFKKFSNPLRRLETIAIDADMREKPIEELHRLGSKIIDRCKEAIADYEATKATESNFPDGGGAGNKRRRDRGPSFKLSSVPINAKSCLACLEELESLDRVVPHAPVERASWILPLKRVKDAHWDVPWGITDDSRLFRGIYEYGIGSWEQIKGDPALNLGDKILLENDVKPQSKHLENRTQYLLKLVKKTQGLMAPKKRVPKSKRAKESKGISKEIIDNDESSDDGRDPSVTNHPVSSSSATRKATKETAKGSEGKCLELNEEEKAAERKPTIAGDSTAVGSESYEEHSSKKKNRKDKREKPKQGPIHITANGEPLPVDGNVELDLNHPLWPECKEKMRPMKKSLKALDKPSSTASPEQQVQHTRSCLIHIGDHIEKILLQYQDHDTRKEWKNLLWQFVSKFTEYEAKKLHKLYKKHRKMMDEKKDGGESKEVKEKKREKHHKEKRNKEEKKSEEKETEHLSKSKRHDHQPHANQHHSQTHQKQSYNGWANERNRENAGGGENNDKERNRNQQRNWRNSGQNREYAKESRYPQDFERDGGYYRDGYKSQHGYHHSGHRDWGQRGRHSRHPGYGPSSGYSHTGGSHYSGSSSGYRTMPHQGGPYGPPSWEHKERGSNRHEWSNKDSDKTERSGRTSNLDWPTNDRTSNSDWPTNDRTSNSDWPTNDRTSNSDWPTNDPRQQRQQY